MPEIIIFLFKDYHFCRIVVEIIKLYMKNVAHFDFFTVSLPEHLYIV